MSQSHFYLTEYKQQQFPSIRPKSAKKLISKTFQQWPKVMKSITQYILPEEYYENKTFKPGVDIYKSLLNEQGPSLKQYYFNIPLTLIGQPYTYDIIYSYSNTLERKMQVNQQQIQSIINLKTIMNNTYNNQYIQANPLEQFNRNSQTPLFVSRITNDRIGCKTTFITVGQYLNKIKTLPKRDDDYYQRFITPYQFKANIIRLHLYTRRSKRQTLTNAIKILNKYAMYNPINKIVQPLLFGINFQKDNSFDTVELKGKPLKSYTIMTQSLVDYLEDYLGVCVTQVVVDYTMDYHKIPWFLSLKSIKYSIKLTKDVKLTAQQLEQLSKSTFCKLCGLNFIKQEVTKMVTFKLIYGFLNHMRQRGVNPQLIIPKANPNLQCKICHLCYKIIMRQIQLYKLSTELAQIQKTLDVVQDITDAPLKDAKIKNKGFRWRLMFYVNGLKQDEQLDKFRDEQLQLQYKIFGTKIRFPFNKKQTKGIFTPLQFSIRPQSSHSQSSHSQSKFLSRSIGKQSTALNLFSKQYNNQFSQTQFMHLKTFYFFSKSQDINSIIKQQQILLRVTKGKDWNNWVCEGSSRTLGYLINSPEQGKTYGSQIYMFFQNMKYMKLNLCLGLAFDGAADIPMCQRCKYNDIELIKGNYYICQPLPQNWLQLFDKQ